MSALDTEPQVEVTCGEPTREEVPIAALTQSQRRLQQLYDMGKILLRFRTIDETIPEVIAVLADALPLRSALLLLTRGSSRMLAFQATGEDPQRLQEAKAHALMAYAYLSPSDSGLAREPALVSKLPPVAPAAGGGEAEADRDFVLLPLVVSGGSIFGALQIQSASALQELDLLFVNTVVNQLATALDRHSVERALRMSEAKLAGILARAVDAVISVDETMRIVMYNDGAERIFGWTAREALRQPLEFLLPERFAETHRQHMRAFVQSDSAARRMAERAPEIIGRRKNGQEFPADASISKLSVGGAWLFTVILRDVSEQKRVDREKSFLVDVSAVLAGTLDSEQILTGIAQLVLREVADFCLIELVDERGELRRLEVAAAEPDKAGIARALKEYGLDRTRPPLSAAMLAENRPRLISQVSDETLRSMAQGEPHWRLLQSLGLQSIVGVPLSVAGRALGALIVGSCRAEHRYTEPDSLLLSEVGGRVALALESARLYRVAQRAIQVRNDVLGVVAHDLRNPLGSILMQAKLLQRSGGQPERRSRKPVVVIERAVQRMNRLIQDLLDVTSIEAGHLSIECSAVPVRQVLCDVVETQQALASARGLELRLDPTSESLQAWADRERLFQVLENLIGNAAKFTAQGGRITIGARRVGAEVQLSVADTGAGIAADDLPHLFERFWQVRTNERRGAGLGLAIVKGLVEAHGGRIWVESALNVGSTFSFTIPALADAPRASL